MKKGIAIQVSLTILFTSFSLTTMAAAVWHLCEFLGKDVQDFARMFIFAWLAIVTAACAIQSYGCLRREFEKKPNKNLWWKYLFGVFVLIAFFCLGSYLWHSFDCTVFNTSRTTNNAFLWTTFLIGAASAFAANEVWLRINPGRSLG